MKQILLLSASALYLASCGGGDLIQSEAKKIAGIVCQAKGADETKSKELQKEIRTSLTILQGKVMEQAKAQSEKSPEDYMKEAGKKMQEAITAEAQKSCGLSEDEVDNFMKNGKVQKTNNGPHLAEVKDLKPEIFTDKDKDGSKTEIYTKITDTGATVWKITYSSKGKFISSNKDVFNFADVDIQYNPIAVTKEDPIIYLEPSYRISFFEKTDDGKKDKFTSEYFFVNKELESKPSGYVSLEFPSEAGAKAIADKINATKTAQ